MASHSDAEVLSAISTPVLVLHGSQTWPFFAMSAQHVGDHVPDARAWAISGAEHAGPLTHPGVLAGELASFFDEISPRPELPQ
ncbi:MAG: alpha/beta hydrolase [Ornithinimicrobium sp.]